MSTVVGAVAVTRIAVFIDYQNVYMRARRSFGHSSLDRYSFGQVHPRRLGLLLEARGRSSDPARELIEVRVYRGEPHSEHDRAAHSACQRQVGRWAKQARVVPRVRPLRYRATAWDRDGRVTAWDVQEKGIDVLLAVDMVKGALRDNYDVAVLVSADTDLLPAVEAVLDDGKRVEVVSWRPDKGRGSRLELPRRNIWCHWLDRVDFDRVRDDTDYAHPGRRRRARS